MIKLIIGRKSWEMSREKENAIMMATTEIGILLFSFFSSLVFKKKDWKVSTLQVILTQIATTKPKQSPN